MSYLKKSKHLKAFIFNENLISKNKNNVLSLPLNVAAVEKFF